MRARNGVGFGPYSDVTSITSDRTPLKMAVPTLVSVQAKEIEISWTILTDFEDIGRDPLTNHQIQFAIAGTYVN